MFCLNEKGFLIKKHTVHSIRWEEMVSESSPGQDNLVHLEKNFSSTVAVAFLTC